MSLSTRLRGAASALSIAHLAGIRADPYQRDANRALCDIIGEPTIAHAILDRLVHNAYRIEFAGESLRQEKGPEPLPAA
jgi:hypothetical protein